MLLSLQWLFENQTSAAGSESVNIQHVCLSAGAEGPGVSGTNQLGQNKVSLSAFSRLRHIYNVSV